MKHTNTFQQVLRQTHYSSAQYVFPCRKEPSSASSSWDVGCRTWSNGLALLRPLTLMPVRRRHQRLKIASASPTPTLGPALSRDSLCKSASFGEGSVFLDEDGLRCFYSERPFPSKEGNSKTLTFSETFSKERFVSSTKSEHLIQNQFSQRPGSCQRCEMRQANTHVTMGELPGNMDPPADWRGEPPASSSFRSKSQVH